jgi:hypothetical protein
MRIVTGIVALLVVCGGCAPAPTPLASSFESLSTAVPASVAPTAAPSQSVVSASPTPTGPASPTPDPASGGAPAAAPPSPSQPLPRTASVEQDDVRVRIELERNPMPAGEITRADITVRNLGSTVLHWFSDGCSNPVYLDGELPIAWRSGIEQTGQAAKFKRHALDVFSNEPTPAPQLRFVPEPMLGTDYGCADIGIGHTIRPGKAIHRTLAWDGMAQLRWGPFPTGPITITGTFNWYWRGRHQPRYPDIPKIEVPLDAWVTGGADETWLSPPEVVDAALTDAAFVSYLETQDLGNGRAEILWYKPELGTWEVGVLPWYETDPPMLHLVLVDPHAGAVTGTVDRPWDEAKDGFP